MIVALGLTLVMFAAQPPQQNGCTLEVDAIQGQLDHAAHRVTTVGDPTRVDLQLEEAMGIQGEIERTESEAAGAEAIVHALLWGRSQK